MSDLNLESLRSFIKRGASSVGTPAVSTHARLSVQGWEDEEVNWPQGPSASLYSGLFASPSGALDNLEACFQALHEAVFWHPDADPTPAALEASGEWRPSLEGYILSLRALHLPAEEVVKRKGTYGTLLTTLCRHLTGLPVLTEEPPVVILFHVLADELGDSPQGDLAQLGRQLDDAVERVRHSQSEFRKARPAPADPVVAPPPVAPPGPANAEPASAGPPPSDAPGTPSPAAVSPPDSPAASTRPSGRHSYERGRPLSREGLFQLVCDEAFKDGVVESWENEALNVLSRFLRIDLAEARDMARGAKEAFDAGQLGSRRPMNPRSLYAKALFIVHSDGQLDSSEEAMLAGLRKLFKIDEAEHLRLLEQVRARQA